MNYLKKIEFLENLAQQARNINATTSSEPIFKMWRNDVKTELTKIYGKESFELQQFETIEFNYNFMLFTVDDDLDALDRDAFRKGIEEAIQYLNLYISRITEETNPIDDAIVGSIQVSNDSDTQISKIFISHASKDKDIVEDLIDLLELIGVESHQIFCSSFEGYGIPLGENFLETIKAQLTNDSLVLFVLTENFYQSAVCMCEMGAAWVLSKKHIPIVVPPLGYADIRGVIPNTQGLEINNAQKWNSLKQQIETQFQINGQENSAGWERKRDPILGRINNHIAEVKN